MARIHSGREPVLAVPMFAKTAPAPVAPAPAAWIEAAVFTALATLWPHLRGCGRSARGRRVGRGRGDGWRRLYGLRPGNWRFPDFSAGGRNSGNFWRLCLYTKRLGGCGHGCGGRLSGVAGGAGLRLLEDLIVLFLVLEEIVGHV